MRSTTGGAGDKRSYRLVVGSKFDAAGHERAGGDVTVGALVDRLEFPDAILAQKRRSELFALVHRKRGGCRCIGIVRGIVVL